MARTHTKKQVMNDPSFKKRKPLDYLPVQRKIQLSVSGSPSAQDGQFDTGRILSQLNHRLYRYGKRYTQKIDVEPAGLNPGSSIEVWALMDTWFVQKAFEEGKVVFDRAYTDERENLSKDARARWFDFRCQSGLTATDLYPVVDADPSTAPAAVIVAGEFNTSIVEDAAGVTKSFSWRAATTSNTYSLIAEYDLAGNTNVSPSTTTGAGPYDDLEADASAVEMEALQARGNSPPYDATAYPSIWVKIATLSVGAPGNQKVSTGYFDAPSGS